MTHAISDDVSAGQATRWLDEREAFAWRALVVGGTMLNERLDRELRQAHRMSLAEYEVLARLSEAEGRAMRMATLAEAASFSRSRVTHTITRLESHGLVERTAAAEDGRGVTAVLTDKGMERLSEAARTHVDGVRRHIYDLASPEDIDALGRIFSAVAGHLAASD